MASRYGYAAIGPTGFGFILMWLTYHMSTKSTGFYRNNWAAMVGVLMRAITSLAYMVLSSMSFRFADTAHINHGVIAGLFSTSVVISTIVFGLIYKERIGLYTFIGMVVIISGVVCVGIKQN